METQSTDWLQRKVLEYKQKTDELNDTCAKLKEDLAAKELNEYEQEVRIRDLRAQLKELSDVEDKLSLANRNARVLEEENNSLLVKLKTAEGGSSSSSTVRVEAVKLIEENNRLQSELQEVRATLNKANQREQQLEQRTKGLLEQQEKAEIQISALKKRNGEIEERLREEQHQWTVSKEAWDSERGRLLQEYEELLSSVQRFDGATQQRESRDVKERGTEQQLQQALLKEDIVELEEKLRVSEERFRNKEREWWQIESALRNEISSLKGSKDQGGKEVYRAFQDQLASFKEEVTAFRGERRPSRAIPNVPVEESVLDDGEDRINELEADLRTKVRKIEVLEVLNQNINQKYMDVSKENEKLQEEIDRLQDRNFRVEERANEHEVRIKELEVLLASAPNNPTAPKIVKLDRENRGDLYADEDRERTLQENQRLRDSLRRCEEEIAELKAAHEQQLAVHEARQSEQQAQIGELLQAESVRQRASAHNSGKGSGQDFLQDHHEPILKENEQSLRFRSKGEPVVVDKLAKDKMESVEDVMRVLEAAWVNEEETKRHLQKLSRQNADLVSMLGNGDQHVKEEELRGHIRSLDEREEQRQRDINQFQAEKDRLADQVDDLRHAIKQKDDKIRDLQYRLSMLENRLKEDEFNQRKQTDTPKDSVMEDRMRKLEAAVAQKEADMNGLAKGRDKRLQELNDQLATMREANDGLWKQLVALQDEKQDSRGRSSGGFSPRTPRSSARRRSMEHLVYSQPTTQTSEERKRTVVADGAHLAVTIVELSDVLRNGRPITEPGFIIIKVKSVKEKYKTSVKELASVIRFDETFVFYLAQPDEDIITLHVFYKPKTSSREYHIGDASFTMATLHRGVPRQRIAIVAQNPGTRDARRAAQVEVIMQSDDFGKMTVPTEAEIEDEKLRFNELLRRVEVSSPEDLHHADVMMAMNNRQ